MYRRSVVHDGVKYVTSSGRRYVLFAHHVELGPRIVRRSDNLGFLRSRKRHADVIIDFVEGKAV